MSAEHTPGPWEVDKDLEVSIDVANPDNGEVSSGWKVVCSQEYAGFAAIVVDMNCPNNWDDALLDANAQLIVAAPDMLTALQAMVTRYVDTVNSGDCGFWDPEQEPQVIAARAAINLALGTAS